LIGKAFQELGGKLKDGKIEVTVKEIPRKLLMIKDLFKLLKLKIIILLTLARKDRLKYVPTKKVEKWRVILGLKSGMMNN